MKNLHKPHRAVIKISLVTLLVLIMMVSFIGTKDFRKDLETVWEANTGRKLQILGSMQISYFPELTITLKQVRLENPENFNKSVFAELSEVELIVPLEALVKQRIEFKALTLKGLKVYLKKDEKGLSNWVDWQGNQSSEEPKPFKQAVAKFFAIIDLKNINISQSHIIFDDQSSRRHIEISGLLLNVAHVQTDRPIPIQLNFDVFQKTPQQAASVQVNSILHIDHEFNALELKPVTVTAKLNNLEEFTLSLNEDRFIFNVSQQQYKFTSFRGELGPMKMSAQFSGAFTDGHFSLHGEVKLPEFNPRPLLEIGQVNLPKQAQPKAFTKFSSGLTLDAGIDKILLSNINGAVDGTLFEGNIELNNFDEPSMRVDLEGGRIDLNQYVGLNSDAQQPNSKFSLNSFAVIAETAWSDLAEFLTIRLSGKLKFREVIVNKLNMQGVSVELGD